MAGHQAAILLIVGLLVVAVVAYLYYMNSQSASVAVGTVTAATGATGVPVAPASPKYTYVLKNQGGVWDPANYGDYTCAQTKIPGYCIVPNTNMAIDLCNQDSKCVGYAVAGNGSGTIQLLAKMPVSNPSANGTFYQKTSA